MLINSRNFALITLFLLLLLVVSLRFDRVEGLPFVYKRVIPESVDSQNYAHMVAYYRGDKTVLPDAPFSYRPLLPWLAAAVPVENPKTALNIINVMCLLLALWLLLDDLKAQSFSLRAQIIGGALFVIAFPTFYYGAIGYVDPGLIAAVALLNRLLTAHRIRWALLVFVAGFLVRDTQVFALPYLVAFLYILYGWRSATMTAVAGICTALIMMKITRIISVNPAYVSWPISLDMLLANLRRPNAYLSFVLALGLPCLFMWVAAIRMFNGSATRAFLLNDAAYVIGWLSWLALFGISLVTAYADGRFVWPAALYAIPLGLRWWRRIQWQHLRRLKHSTR